MKPVTATRIGRGLITVQWTGPANEGDMISLADAGQLDNAYQTYSRLNAGGEVQLQVPGNPGDYELRYVPNEGRIAIAMEPITVTEVAVTLDARA